MIKSARKPPKLEKKLLTPRQLAQHNFRQGYSGEQQAADYLVARDYQILDTNVRYKLHELDIVARDTRHHELVFCEVKTRLGSEFGHGAQAINSRKLLSMKLVAELYLTKHRLTEDFRFDLLVVWPGRIEHFTNITWT